MSISTELSYASVDELMLDPMNPRLGRSQVGPEVAQGKVLDLMKDWSLEELATSFLESGFWPQEALLVIRERLYGKLALVVVEGNRRLAALKMLKRAFDGKSVDERWRDLVRGERRPTKLFSHIPIFRLAVERISNPSWVSGM